jgi:hypothetical protein|tara:strand:- start:1038 stop:1790 length:753 start_codon:yes stop_codon:yes gene_type:complete
MKKNKEKQGSILLSKSQYNLNEKRKKYFENSKGSLIDKINSFTRYVSRQNIAKLIAQYELIKETKGVLGDIVEAGVYYGSGLMGWANICCSIEPYNYQCKIIGFDTFKGSLGVSNKDNSPILQRRNGEYKAEVFDDLKKSIELINFDRPLNHLEKIKIIKGDLSKTSKKFVADNKALSIRILHIGVNLYKPTYCTLKNFLPAMSKGSVVVIDGLNYSTGGCMQALKKTIDIKKIKIQTFDYYPNFTYFKL